MKNQGVVAVFRRDRFDRYSNFARIGDGSLGGKGRGLAFIDNLVKHHPEFEEFENARVAIPKTIVLCTDVFDEFMDTNNLYQIALSDADDDVILRYFLKAKLPDRLVEDFFTFFDVVKSPLAIRSSSLLEDSHYQLRRYLQHLYDSLSGRQVRDAAHAERCHQGSICFGLLPRLEGIHAGNEQRYRPGKDGCHPARGSGQPVW